MIKYAIPLMKAGGEKILSKSTLCEDYKVNIATRGAIVNISSIAAKAAVPANSMAYCTSKAAVSMMTKCMAEELAAYKIRINDVCPGTVYTPMHEL